MPEPRAVFQRMGDFSVGKWAGDVLYLSGLVAVRPGTQEIIMGYGDLPDHGQQLCTGQHSVDTMEGPITAQAWYVLSQLKRIVERQGLSLEHVVHLTHFMTDRRDFPAYNRVRNMFFESDPPTSTVVFVAGLLPSSAVRLEVEARVSRHSPASIGHVAELEDL